MLNEMFSAIDTSEWAQSALVLFFFASILIIYATLRLSRSSTDRFAAIPLSDRVEDPRDDRS